MKYLIPFLLLLAACRTSSQLDQHDISLIILTNTIVAYHGKLDKDTKIERIAINEKDVKAFLVKIYDIDSSANFLLKPEAMANVGGNMESIIAWCRELNITIPKITPSSPEDKKYLGFAGMPQEFWEHPEPMHLNLPKDAVDSTIKPTDKTYTILLLKNDKVYIYLGESPNKKIAMAQISDVAIKNSLLDGQKKYKQDFLVLIKPLKDATYKNTVDILDEMINNNIKRYSMVEGSEADAAFAEKLQSTSN